MRGTRMIQEQTPVNPDKILVQRSVRWRRIASFRTGVYPATLDFLAMFISPIKTPL